MKYKREQSEELQPMLRGEEVTVVTAFNPCGCLLCSEEVHSHTHFCAIKQLLHGGPQKRKKEKNPKPAQLRVPYGYGHESS